MSELSPELLQRLKIDMDERFQRMFIALILRAPEHTETHGPRSGVARMPPPFALRGPAGSA
jgi:hypothetical protein